MQTATGASTAVTVQVYAAVLPAAISDSCLRDTDRSDPVPVTETWLHTVAPSSHRLPSALACPPYYMVVA